MNDAEHIDSFTRPALNQVPGLDLDNDALVDLMRAVLDRGSGFVFRARGQSMWPFIRDGDQITVVPLSQGAVGVGRVVAYVQPMSGKLIVHRVVAARDGTFTIRGDNALSQSYDHIEKGDILGCVTRVVRGDRRLRLGLGVERHLIALISRQRWLSWLAARLAWRITRIRG